MIFLDTSAIYALADESDSNHGRALELFGHAIDADEALLIHSYMLVESTALLQHRLRLDSALKFLQDIGGFQSHWVTAEDHEEAVVILRETEKARVESGGLCELRSDGTLSGRRRTCLRLRF